MKNFIYLSFLTAFVVLSWIIFSIVHNSTTSTISQDTSIIITPIPPNFDTKTLDDIKKRKNLSVNLEADFISSASSETTTPIPTRAPTPSTSSSASATINETSTPRGSIP